MSFLRICGYSFDNLLSETLKMIKKGEIYQTYKLYMGNHDMTTFKNSLGGWPVGID